MPNRTRYGHDLEDSIAFLLRVAQSTSFAAFVASAHDPRLKPGRYAILSFIGRKPGIRQNELSALVNRDKTTLTSALNGLEREGLVVRQTDPLDGRGRRLILTPQGKTTLRKLRVHAVAYDRRLDEIMGQDDRESLMRLLRKLIDGIGRELADGSPATENDTVSFI